jgi:hypothetical protein
MAVKFNAIKKKLPLTSVKKKPDYIYYYIYYFKYYLIYIINLLYYIKFIIIKIKNGNR